MWGVVLALFAVLLYLLYRWSTNTYDFFEVRGIPYSKPFPLFGSMKDVLFKKTTFFDLLEKLYREHTGKFYGIFDQRRPALLIKDPELIKQITIKDFEHFLNHRGFTAEDDNLFASSLVNMRDAKWREMRNTLSPVFTGSKMRSMFQLMNEVASEATKYLRYMPSMNEKDGLELDMKEFTTCYTNDIIASTAFGIRVNSFDDKTNKFYTLGRRLTKFTTWTNIKFLVMLQLPKLYKLLRLQLFDKEVIDYFMDLVIGGMKYRFDNNIVRPDMINMLMEARGMTHTENTKPPGREWTDVEIVAQCFVFFFAGFETTASCMCFTAHELMENPEIQQRLYEEIQEVKAELNDGPLTYDALQRMKYLDMVVSESLRKWPIAGATDRECNKDFSCEVDGQRLEIKRGQTVMIPIVALHHDEQYFENPLEFNPERFSDCNKDQITPYTYFPFGLGPRNCIGNRFALLETKALIYHLLDNFKFEISTKSTVPMRLAKNFQLAPENGFWIKFTKRNE